MLELNNVTSGYGKFQVLKEVSIEVNSGEIVCVVGANGAGKTTLMRAISGILPLWSGAKKFKGKDVSRMHPTKLTREGIIQIPEGRLIIKVIPLSNSINFRNRLSLGKRLMRVP